MCSACGSQLPEERSEAIVQQPVSQSAAALLVPRLAEAHRLTTGLDKASLARYGTVSIPAGPLSQDMLSLGGFFIGGAT